MCLLQGADFNRTTRAGSVSRESELRIRGDRLVGRLVHGPQKTWSIDIDVRFGGVPAETIARPVTLACDSILSAHHGD